MTSELTNELAAKKGELEKHVNELKEKNQENTNLSKSGKNMVSAEMMKEKKFCFDSFFLCSSVLNITDLQSQLENLEKVKTAEDKESAATISSKYFSFDL